MRFLKPKSAANRPIKKSLAHHESQNTVYLYICIEYIYSAVFRLYQLYTFAFCMYIVVTAPLSRIGHSCKPRHTPTYRPFSTSFKRLAAPRSAAIGALLRTTRPSTPNLPTISKNFSKNTCQLEPLVVYLGCRWFDGPLITRAPRDATHEGPTSRLVLKTSYLASGVGYAGSHVTLTDAIFSLLVIPA